MIGAPGRSWGACGGGMRDGALVGGGIWIPFRRTKEIYCHGSTGWTNPRNGEQGLRMSRRLGVGEYIDKRMQIGVKFSPMKFEG